MSSQNSLFTLPSLDSVIDRTPLTVAGDTSVIEAIALMNQVRKNSRELEGTNKSSTVGLLNPKRNNCLLIVEAEKLVGIFTERDVVKLTASQRDLQEIAIAQVMTRKLVTLKPSPNLTILNALSLLRGHQINHLPVIGEQGELQGLITQTNLLQAIDPVELLKVVEMLQQQVGEKTTALQQEINRREQTEAQLEMQVQERTAELTDFIENAVLPMHWVASDGTIAWANQAELDLLGYTKEEYFGRSIIDFHVQRAVIDELLGRLSNNETVSNYQAQLRCKDGSIRYVEIDSNVSWQNGKFIHTRCFTRDVTENCQTQKQLQETLRSLEFQKYALDKAAIVAITDVKGIITYVNGQFCQISQYEKAELIGKTHRIINSGYHPAEFFQELWITIVSGQVWQGEVKNRAKDGSFYWVDTTIVPFLDETGKPFQYLAIRFDISDRKQAEEALRQSEQKFRAIFDSTFSFIGLLTTEGVLIEANQTALNAIGVSSEDVIGQPFWQTPWWGHSQALQQELQQAIDKAAGGELARFEAEHPLPDGTMVIVDFSLKPVFDEAGKVVMLIPEGRDISDRKIAEQKISEQAALLDIATDAIMVRDLNQHILFWNKGAEKLYGWQASEAVGQDLRLLLCREASSAAETANATVLEKGEWQGELHKVIKSGKEVTVASRWTLVKDEVESPKFILIVDTDITERKQLESQFLRAQRLESLGTLASGIAHDMNNILTPILGASQLLPLKLSNPDHMTQQLLQMLQDNAKRGADLVSQILAFARGAEVEGTQIQIVHILKEVVNVARQTFPKTIEINSDWARELWLISGDGTQLHQVLMNLLINARDAMPEGGDLRITAENLSIDESYARMNLDAKVGLYILITVADTGMGIPQATIERIFDPFFTTKEPGKGTGLGLSTVIGIIKSHQGFVNVYSEVGKGTSFKIYLPADENPETTQPVEDLELLKGNEELVLVVDDEASVREITKVTLENYHYRVITANDGIDAIALYAQHHHEIAVVLLDLMMPSLDTATIVQTLERINPKLKIIAMSGLSANGEVISASYPCIQAFLAKPFTSQKILQMLHETV